MQQHISCVREITVLTRLIKRKLIVFICFKGRKAHSISHSGRHRAPPKHPKLILKSLSSTSCFETGGKSWLHILIFLFMFYFSKSLHFFHLTFLSWLHILIFPFMLDFFKILSHISRLTFLSWLPAALSPALTLSEMIWGWSLGIRPTFPTTHLRFINPYASQLV